MNINQVVCVRSNWFAEIKTGTMIGECPLVENPAVLKSWRIPKELRYFDTKYGTKDIVYM